MSDPRLTYTPLLEATPESELDALAAIYKFVIECHEAKKVAGGVGDRTEVKEVADIDPEQRLPQ
jgi:hypothetical protein